MDLDDIINSVASGAGDVMLPHKDDKAKRRRKKSPAVSSEDTASETTSQCVSYPLNLLLVYKLCLIGPMVRHYALLYVDKTLERHISLRSPERS